MCLTVVKVVSDLRTALFLKMESQNSGNRGGRLWKMEDRQVISEMEPSVGMLTESGTFMKAILDHIKNSYD
jgi:hypothetical protein